MNTRTSTSDWALQSRAGLLSSQLTKVGIILAGCVFSVYIGMQVADQDSNGLATFVRYVAVVIFVFSVVSPRKGIYLVLFMSPVLDLLKRLLVIFTAVDYVDIASVLALAPLCMAGTLIGTFGSRVVFGKRLFEPREKSVFLLLLAMLALITVGALHSGDSKLRILQTLAESCSYLGLMLMVSIHFPTREDAAQFFRWCLVVFLPVALYGFWQRIFGFSDLEVRYMLSGLSISEKEFYADVPRIYSTLNSNHSFSIVMSCCALLALLQRHMVARSNWHALIKALGPVLFLFFSAASLVSLRRTGWLVIIFALAAAWSFRSKARTWTFYAVVLGATMLLIFNAGFVMLQLPYWEGILQSWFGNAGEYALVLQTFNDRLMSFQNLVENHEIWTLLGLPVGVDPGPVHDAITQVLVGYGVVGLLVAAGAVVGVLAVSNRLVWRASDSDRRYLVLLTGIVFSNVLVGVLMQNHIGLFPVNLIFWFCVGALLNAVVINPETENASMSDLEPEPVLEPAVGEAAATGRKPLSATAA